MTGKLSLIVAALSLVGAMVVSSATAAGIQRHRVVAGPSPTADRASAATGSTLIAPTTVCPDQGDLGGPAAAQERTMTCMVDFARRQTGLSELTDSDALAQSALDKSLDVLRCDSFSHFACGREFSYWMRQAGYMSAPCWHVGENLAWGSGEYGTVRSIFRAWMASPEHRANILGDYSETGVSVRVGTLGGLEGARVWTEHFGSRCA